MRNWIKYLNLSKTKKERDVFMNDPETIEIVEYDTKWPEIFGNEAKLIQEALGENCFAIEHFGSTAVPGLCAKPKIDILAVVKDLSLTPVAALERIGFENRGEVIPSGRYFCKAVVPRIHLHIFEEGNPLVEQNLKFRDHLRAHPKDRAAYAKLKKELAADHSDGMSYCHAKTDFINQILQKI